MSPKIDKNNVYLLAAALLILLTGCTAIGNVAMEAAGIKKPELPELPDSQKAPRTIQINLHAGNNLNLDASGRPLALIAKIYKLRQNAAFQQASYATFLSSAKEKETLGADLLEVKEVTLVPGQVYQANEKVSMEAYFIGVVGLFRAPALQHWRATFSAESAEKTGITIGMHACALSVSNGSTVNENNLNTLSSVQCP